MIAAANCHAEKGTRREQVIDIYTSIDRYRTNRPLTPSDDAKDLRQGAIDIVPDPPFFSGVRLEDLARIPPESMFNSHICVHLLQ